VIVIRCHVLYNLPTPTNKIKGQSIFAPGGITQTGYFKGKEMSHGVTMVTFIGRCCNRVGRGSIFSDPTRPTQNLTRSYPTHVLELMS